MKLFYGLAAAALFLGLTTSGHAQEFGGDDMNGFIGLGLGVASHSSNYNQTPSSGSRLNYNLEFGRLASNVSATVTYGKGMGYDSLGGRFKVFRPVPIPESGAPILVIPGIGFAVDTAITGIVRAGETGKSRFTDLFLGPDLRAMYDFKIGLAVSLDFHYDFSLRRNWLNTTAAKVQTSPHDKVMYFGLSVMFDSRFIE